MNHPKIIQGGMGVGISNWRLAKAVSEQGHLGVVSGVFLNLIMARLLQLGDQGGHISRACKYFPFPEIVRRIYNRYYIKGGKISNKPFKHVPMFTLNPEQELLELTVLANFVEIFLAKEGHDGIIGVNYLEKIQMPNLASIYGAMLAGVDYVLMGAGIPREIPKVLDDFSKQQEASLCINVEGAKNKNDFQMHFDPEKIIGKINYPLKRPQFLAIIASNTLALSLTQKSSGKIDGFIIEGSTAGGHNAPPRGQFQLSENGEPIYGERDRVDLEKIKTLGLPFWLAGSYASRLQEALNQGATGIQVGTPFAFCKESGLSPELKRQALRLIKAGEAWVFTDPKASPTGFPFKVLLLDGTISSETIYEQRERTCDLGFLQTPVRHEDRNISYRCHSEPVSSCCRKLGIPEDTTRKKCLCNGLMANIGLPQVRGNGYVELPLVTAGADLSFVAKLLTNLGDSDEYTSYDVISHIQS